MMAESQNMYGQFQDTVLPHPLFLRILADYYRNFVHSLPEALFVDGRLFDTPLEPALSQRLRETLKQCDTLAAHEHVFCRHFGITSMKNEDFSQECTRIALIPQDFLCHVALMTGMALCCQSIATTVLRQDVARIRALEQHIPSHHEALQNKSPYMFSLKKAFMYKGHSEHVLQHATQDVNTHAFGALPLDRRIVAWGLWCVLSCVQGAGHDALLRTLVLLHDLSTLVSDIPLFSQHMGTTLAEALPQESLSWPLVRVLIFKEITCPWEEGWTTFFA